VWAASALALVFALIATIVIVALTPRVDGVEYVATSTNVLDFMSATAPATDASAAESSVPLIGGDYSLEPASSFSTADGMTTVVAGTISAPATALTGSAASTDSVTTVTLATLDRSSDDVSAAVVGRSSAEGAYRAVVTIRSDGTAAVRIERTGVVPVILASAMLPETRDWTSRTVVELTLTGSDEVVVRARVWGDDGASAAVIVQSTDASDGRLLAGRGGYSAWTTGSGRASAVVDALSAFALRVVEPMQPESAIRVPLREIPVVTNTGERRDGAGAAVVGSTSYQVPTGAVVVSPQGRDGARGTMTDPVSSVKKAIAMAAPGATIVLRAGTYHESVVVPAGSHLTIQSAPGEAVWVDGSSTLTNFTGIEGAWQVDGWDTVFDSSPTYTAGAADGTTDGWSFINADKPMAAHPDQVWIDDVALDQVESRSDVVAGTFHVDYDTQTLTIGSDPAGHTVRASDRELAVSLRSTDSTLRGIGVRRFSPSVPQLGAVRAEEASATIENVAILDSATTGLFIRDPHSRIRDVTVARSGMLGIAVSYADDLRVSGVVSVDNNTEGFNPSPVSGGMKITRSREVAVVDSVFDSNAGPGLWFDESIYGGVATGNDISDNATHGLVLEISSTFVVADNVISGNGENGIKVNNTDAVQVWNNTLVGNGRTINIVQDGRRASDPKDAGHDPRQPFPDPTMSWIVGDIVVSNNVLAESTGNCLLCVEDFSKEFTAEQLGVIAEGNVYQRPDAQSPSWLVVWSRGAETNPAVFTSLDDFRAQTTLESAGLEILGASAANDTGTVDSSVADRAPTVASALPRAVATLVHQRAGTLALGAWGTRSAG
jgi:parallel beta-helix repeat protein